MHVTLNVMDEVKAHLRPADEVQFQYLNILTPCAYNLLLKQIVAVHGSDLNILDTVRYCTFAVI